MSVKPARAYVAFEDLIALQHQTRGFSFLPRQPIHNILTGRHASRLRGRGLDFQELRHYAEGDDVRTMDWLATARLNSPQIRVFTEEVDRNVILIVDQRVSMFFGSQRTTKSVAAAETAALAAWRTTAAGDRAGAIIFSDSDIVEVKPHARNRGVLPILHELVRFNHLLTAAPPGNPAALNRALHHAAKLAKHDCLLCLIGDASGADADTIELVTGLSAHNDVLAIFVFDPLEASMPNIGSVTVTDVKFQLELDTAPGGFRRRYAESFAQRRRLIEQLSRERAIPVLDVCTDQAIAAQLRENLGRRAQATRSRAASGVG